MIRLRENLKYFQIPGYPDYGIDEDGTVYSSITTKELSGSINPAGYCHYRLRNDKGDTMTIGRHRLMCLTFKPIANPEEKYVNHKNGIKGDDFLDNLEWATPQQNCHHAGLNKLSSKCKPVLVRDASTGEVDFYPSLKEAGVCLDMSYEAIKYRVQFSEGTIWPEQKQYSLVLEKPKWTENTKTMTPGNTKKICVKKVLTGEIFEFSKINEAASFFDIVPTYISEWLKKGHQLTTTKLLQFKLGDEDWRTFEDPYEDYERCTSQRVVIVKNMDIGKETIFLTAKDAYETLEINKTTLFYRCKTKGERIFDNCTYCFYSDRKNTGRL
ncbi:putative endonuclease [Vibrio phage C-ZP2022]|nr:putative endonuclease [Vibrio phage C-ZP2022]